MKNSAGLPAIRAVPRDEKDIGTIFIDYYWAEMYTKEQYPIKISSKVEFIKDSASDASIS